MLVLGLDTATKAASIGLIRGKRLLGEFNLQVDRVHSKRIMPMVDQLLKETDCNVNDIQGIAVSSGPGSFTGLRIGMSTAKGLAYALSVPLVGVSTLKGLCCNCIPNLSILCPVLDARMNEFYTALYKWDRTGLKALVTDTVLSRDKLLEMIKSVDGQVVMIADPSVQEALSYGEFIQYAPFSQAFPRGVSIAALGLEDLNRGAADSLLTLQPTYIRRSQAEILHDKKKKV